MVYFNEMADMHYKPRRIAYDRETDRPVHRDGKMEIAVEEIQRTYDDPRIQGFTYPGKRPSSINRQPFEFTVYDLITTGELPRHETLHIISENGLNEVYVTRRAKNPASDVEFHNRARLVRR